MRLVVAVVVFLNAFLLFLVEPMIARIMLPAFGGAPSVWTTSMLFFQTALLLGYGYAHWVRRLPPTAQIAVHAILLGVGVLQMPFALASGVGAATGANPTWSVLFTLARTIGPAFIALSAGSSLLQSWYAAGNDGDPYHLYAASNIGSLLALLAYPFFVEPRYGVHDQTHLYRSGYVALVIAIVAFGVMSILAKRATSEHAPIESTAPTPWRTRMRWVALAAIPSSLMLGVTNYLSANVAPIPLLWVVPLSLYLLSFVFAFARKQWVPPKALSRLLPLLLTPLVVTIVMEATEPMALMAGINLVVLLVAAWMCHGFLAESRPEAAKLTEFYFWLAVGGAVGGLFNSLVAPVVFSSYAEYPIALVAACAVRLPYREPVGDDRAGRRLDGLIPVGISFLLIVLVLGVRLAEMEPSPVRTAIIVGLPCVLCFFAVDRPIRFSLCIGAVFLWSSLLHTNSDGGVIYAERSFYGVHRVIASKHARMHQLVHGNTVHGRQSLDDPTTPLTYYHPSGPTGSIFKAYGEDPSKSNVALVGLGAGSIAAYGRPGQTYTYFEIDPAVMRIATDPKFFTFIRDGKAKVNFVVGDARLTLAQRTDQFGLIVLDAFSSDSIPVHLLTREAIQMYLAKLDPHGVLAFHISNRYLDLEPVLGQAAKDAHLQAAVYLDGASPDQAEAGKTQSKWLVMARKEADLTALLVDRSWGEADVPAGTKAWTDDFSNVVGAFKGPDQ